MLSTKLKTALWAILAVIIISFSVYNYNKSSLKSVEKDVLDVSWMTSWATTGQVMVAIENTNIRDVTDSESVLQPFLFGPEMNEAARAGRIDVTNTGVVPTVNLLAADEDWIIVSRLIHFSVSLLVPKDSAIKDIQSLAGKKVGVPFGGGSHPYMLQRLREVGIEEGRGPYKVELINLKPPEQVAALSSGDVDAIATWEPQTALARTQLNAKVIDQDIHVGFVAIRKSFAEDNPEEVVDLLESYILAHFYVAQNKEQTDEWFATASKFDAGLLKSIEVIEPNINAKSLSDISITLSNEDISRSQIVADVMFEAGLIPTKVDIQARVDLSFLDRARKSVSSKMTAELDAR